MTWEERYQVWAAAIRAKGPDDAPERRPILEAARAVAGRLDTPQDWAWVKAAVADRERRFFVALVFEKRSAPKWLAYALLDAGVSERNPSANKFLVRPAVRSLGPRRVLERLLDHLQSGSDAQKAGAASAAYWVEIGPDDPDCADLVARFRLETLRQFVTNADLDVRRRILPGLILDAEAYPSEAAPLIARAIAIAREHDDPYIRHRIEVQLGNEAVFQPIPPAED